MLKSFLLKNFGWELPKRLQICENPDYYAAQIPQAVYWHDEAQKTGIENSFACNSNLVGSRYRGPGAWFVVPILRGGGGERRKKVVKKVFFCEIFFSRFRKRVHGKERERVVRELESHSDLSCN